MGNFYTNIEIAHRQVNLNSSGVDSFKSLQDKRKTAVFYESQNNPHDFYLSKSNGILIMDSPAGPASQVMSVVERIAQLEGAKLLIDSRDVPKEFKEQLLQEGYKRVGDYFQK
jgi:hypothetical protein